MLKNLSVSAKGFLAFGLLAAIAIAASTFMHNRAITASEQVAETATMNRAVEVIEELSANLYVADLQLKTFLLTGNRDYAAGAEKMAADMTEKRPAIEAMLSTSAPAELAKFKDAITAFETWKTASCHVRSS